MSERREAKRFATNGLLSGSDLAFYGETSMRLGIRTMTTRVRVHSVPPCIVEWMRRRTTWRHPVQACEMAFLILPAFAWRIR
ncbi:hypothetical protein ccbrp13_63040 [Ktedonobacteria bacterium brp13]|nr:hypothetical protein ccbrp13_63040 [Ktedonobacteria bacterium brp13]